jgi:hypothetical protein
MLQRTVASMCPGALSAAFSDLRHRAHAELALNSDQEKYPLLPSRCILTVEETEVGNNRPLELPVHVASPAKCIKEHRPQLARQMMRQYGLWRG